MTESQWAACSQTRSMLEFLRGRISEPTIRVKGDLSEPQRIWLDDAIGNTPWNHQALTKLGEMLQQAFGVPVRLERPKCNSPGRRAA